MDSMHSTSGKTRKSGHSLTKAALAQARRSTGTYHGKKVYVLKVRFPAGRICTIEEPL